MIIKTFYKCDACDREFSLQGGERPISLWLRAEGSSENLCGDRHYCSKQCIDTLISICDLNRNNGEK